MTAGLAEAGVPLLVVVGVGRIEEVLSVGVVRPRGGGSERMEGDVRGPPGA